MKVSTIILIYLLLINLIGFISMGVDKHKAKSHAWRTPEARLLGIAIIGGSFGSIMGMGIFHHKTKHMKFCVGLPVIFFLQLCLAGFIVLKVHGVV